MEASKFFGEEIQRKAAENAGKTAGMNASYKFDVQGAGVWRLLIDDGTINVEEGDGDAQCTVVISAEDFDQLTDGKLNPQMAFMSGKLKIQGDMGLAMKLGQVL